MGNDAKTARTSSGIVAGLVGGDVARVDGTIGEDREGGVDRDEGAVDIVGAFWCAQSVRDVELDVEDGEERKGDGGDREQGSD